MKKGLLITSIILWSLVIVAIVGVIIIGFDWIDVKSNTGPSVLIKQESIQLGNATKITVKGVSHEIEVHKTSGTSIEVSQYGSENTATEKLFKVSVTDNEIQIYFNNYKWSGSWFKIYVHEKLIVEIPDSFVDNLSVSTTSGEITLLDEYTLKNIDLSFSSGGATINENIYASKINVSSTSGDIEFKKNVTSESDISVTCSSGNIKFFGDVVASSININVTSGNIRLYSRMTANSINIRLSSGNVVLEYADVASYYIYATSGNITCRSISGGGTVKVSSGTVDLSLVEPTGNIDVSSTSGTIKLKVQASLSFTFSARVTSGSIRTSFATLTNGNYKTATVGDNPTANITLDASSGTIRVDVI